MFVYYFLVFLNNVNTDCKKIKKAVFFVNIFLTQLPNDVITPYLSANNFIGKTNCVAPKCCTPNAAHSLALSHP